MTNHERGSITITLSPTQVDEVVREATFSRTPSVSTLIGNALRAPLRSERPAGPASARAPAGSASDGSPSNGFALEDSDPRLSRSLLRGLSLLTCFDADGSARGIVEIARDLDMSPSTAHRYASTLVELGLLERDPMSRKYRLPAGS
jgi:IclR-like helix-turn-helix domain-containing protein